MYSYQVESEILALVIDVELRISALFALHIDVLLDAGRNIRGADLFFRAGFLWVLCAFLRMLRVLLGKDRRRWCEEQCDNYGRDKS